MNTATAVEMAYSIKEYLKDPNCRAELWVSNKEFDHWTKEQKHAFISVCNDIKVMDTKLRKLASPVS